MKKRLIISTMLGILLMSALTADTIELWNGTVIKGVEISGANEGLLRYSNEGKSKSIPLTDIRSIVRGSNNCQIVRFIDYVDKKREVKLLTIRVDETQQVRIRRPLVRLFTCVKTRRGTYEVSLYSNSRTDDPTNAGELEEVDAADFLNRHYILKNPEGLAFRVEIWRDGKLQVAENYGNDNKALPGEWYRLFEVKSTRTLRLADDVVIEDAVQVLEGEEKTPVEKGWGIDSVSVLPEVLDTVPRLKVDFSMLNAAETTTTTPKVIFHYVTETAEGEKEISKVTVTAKSGKDVALVDGRFRGSVEKKLPSKLRLTKLEALKQGGLVELIHWRVELVRDDQVLAVKEKNGRMKTTLPAKWWE